MKKSKYSFSHFTLSMILFSWKGLTTTIFWDFVKEQEPDAKCLKRENPVNIQSDYHKYIPL